MIKVLIITGSVGVGKSSVAAAISEKLNKDGVTHALIDMDYLRYAFPRPKHDPFHRVLGIKNLASVASNYIEAGITNFIIPNVVEHQDDVDDIKKSIPEAGLLVVRLRAKIETVHSRIKQRETGDSLDWHLNRAVELTEQLEQSKVEDLVIDTDDKTILEIAEAIIDRWLGN